MRQNNNDNEGFVESIRKYIDLKAEFYRLSFVEKVSVLVGKVVLMILTALLALVLLLLFIILIHDVMMAWIGIGWVVSLIEIGFVALLMALLWAFRGPLIIRPVAGSVIRGLMDTDDKEKEEEDEDD